MADLCVSNMIEIIFYRDRDKHPLSSFKLKLHFLLAWDALMYVNNTRQQDHLVDQDMQTGKNTARLAGCL